MTPEQFKNLKEGDFIRHINDLVAYQVHGNYGDRVIAVRIVEAANPDEWEIVNVPYQQSS